MSVVEMLQPKKKGSSANEPMSNGRVAEANRWINDFYSTSGKSLDVLGRELGYDGSSLGLFMKDKYTARPNAIVEAIERYRETVTARSALVLDAPFAETSIAKSITQSLSRLAILSRLGLIAGEAGTGKTSGLRQYAKDHPKTVYVALDPAISNRGSLLDELRFVLTGEDSHTSSPAREVRGIVHTLNGTGRMVILDEAHYLNAECIDLLRCIQDRSGVPMVLAGNESVYELGPRGSGGRAAFTQFTSRCAVKLLCRTSTITKADVLMIAKHFLGVELAEEVSDILLAQARQGGGFRRLVILLQIAQTLVENERSVTKNHINKAAKQLAHMGGVV